MKNLIVECKSLPIKLPEHLAIEVDEIVKALPEDCKTMHHKAYQVEYNFEPGEQSEVSIISAPTVDKENEVILPEGVDFTSYRKSAVVLWSHDWNRPVGTCSWIKLHNGMIKAKSIYPKDGPDWSNTVWKMISSNPPILKGKSIGFLPRTPKRTATEEEITLHPEWKDAGIWDNVLLLEYSCCPTPICDDALVEAINNKSLNTGVLKQLGVHYWEGLETKMEEEDCVSKKIKEMYAQGEDKKYSRCQIEAIAKASIYGQKVKMPPRNKVREQIQLDSLVEKSLNCLIEKIDLDPDKLANMAMELYKNRGKV